MGKYKITYTRETARVMIVEANSEIEAKKKYEDYDCIEDYEDYGIDEEIGDIKKIE